ncbi:hypothetical protein Desde_2019 [Desulfitobacterium dehalogenans ATCC 51507]|uniref:Glycosyltransferase RgtA/B/C/D-like domain-containing protein n=1 Tax=Desulfitobacterium dehalogenans (strain ATCC 51507 / DSM 9161 / JW/IU-DC1) TaxID=756499 RepID=I4A8W9_DESDJ|nr:DUF6056 family protein [Desulfitobacterium dehalogenans]AFM00404.1 hypothetical protein Desde_2019 [Desulfitobacterium dehalogenans ATCC 51507]
MFKNLYAYLKSSSRCSKRDWLILLVFLFAMLWIHRYIFLYADDLYYSRDAQYGLNYLPEALLDELNSNGRVWIGGAMVLALKPQIEFFRILNPLILMSVVYILAKMATFSESSLHKKKDNPSLWIALLCAVLFFLFLPLKIAHITIYYAACAFNYLYPMALVLLYAYLLYTRIGSRSLSKKLLLIALAFFVGSSTQQVGMIGIGFTVMISVYLSFIRRKLPFRTFLPLYGVMFLGYILVSYGSLKRLVWERTAGNEVVLTDVITELIKTNIFSLPAAPFVMLISLSCIFWLFAFSRPGSPAGDPPSVAATLSSSEWSRTAGSEFRSETSSAQEKHFSAETWYCEPMCRKQRIFNRSIAILLCAALTGYIYLLLYKKIPFDLTHENLHSFYGLSIIAFVFLYFSALVYISVIMLIKKDYPFLLFNTINALGAQIMLIVVDARFAATYKVMFPSLLLFSVFIFYSVLAFRRNTLYLSLAFFFLTLSLQEKLPALAGGVIFGLALIHYLYSMFREEGSGSGIKLIQVGLGVFFCLISVMVFGTTLHGYYQASIPQNYNLEAIKQYHEGEKKGELLLKKVPPSYYGYNLGNWNDMPYFMKQCYGIKEDTPINYIQ